MKMSILETRLQVFIGHAKRIGATKEELEILVKAMDLIRKYPLSKKD